MSEVPDRGFTATFATAAVVLLIAFLVALFLGTAHSQEAPQIPRCGPRVMMEKAIKDKYGEVPIGIGVDETSLIILLRNRKTRSFTILARQPSKMACVIVSGTDYEIFEDKGDL
jgi:hypothetical protein